MWVMVPIPAPPLKVQDLSRWAPAADRRNPIAVLQEQEADRLPWLVPVRHSRMAHDAFAFYRGTPAVMAHDLGNAPPRFQERCHPFDPSIRGLEDMTNASLQRGR